MDSQSCEKYSDDWPLLITSICRLVCALKQLFSTSLMKMGDKNWMLERFLQTLTGYCTEETEMEREGGKRREQVSPLKSLPVRWSEDSVKHGPGWLPFLTEKHSTILLTRCLVSLVCRLQVEGFFVFRQKGMTSLTDMHMQVPPSHPCSQWRRYSIPLRSI